MNAKKAKASPDASPKRRGTKKDATEAAAIVVGFPPSDLEVVGVAIPLDSIDYYPRNYRKYYDPVALAEFAAAMKAVGRVISPITLRVVTTGRYQLVAGERRVRGARMAGFTHIPAVIGTFTDEEVEEIQLQENIQREDPHPMHEAECIRRMYDRGLRTEEIALRLGKSVTWVYNRSKLSGLTPDLQEMFLAGVLTVGEAYEIADLAPEAQEGFFSRYCKRWKEHAPSFGNLSHNLSPFKCDLARAPFDLNDAELLPEAGACVGCQFNTAFKGLLIPDLEGTAKCTRMACFDRKYQLQLNQTIRATLATDEPVALIIDGQLPENIKAIVDDIPGTADLPVYQLENVTVIEEPEKPDIEDFQNENVSGWGYEKDEEEDDAPGRGDHPEDAEGEPSEEDETFDREGYASAEAEYAELIAEYQKEISNGKSLKGFLIERDEFKIVYYYPVPAGKRLTSGKNEKRQKVKDLIAAKQDTPEILQAEISRIQTREVRNKELDVEKVQKQVHTELVSATTVEKAVFSMTDQDRFAARWLIFHSVAHYVRDEIETILDMHVDYKSKPESVFEAISKMTDSQYAGLIRMALAGLPESKVPKSISGYFLRQVAEGAGVNTEAIEKKQNERAQHRVDTQEVTIGLYKKRIKRHQGKKAA